MKYLVYTILTLILLSMTFSCVSTNVIKKEEVYKTARAEEEITVSPQAAVAEEEEEEEEKKSVEEKNVSVSDIIGDTDFFKNLDAEQLAELNRYYDSYLNYGPHEAPGFLHSLKKEIADAGKTHLAGVCLAILRNNDFSRLHYKTGKLLSNMLVELAYAKNNRDVQSFIDNHMSEESLVSIINKDYFVLHKIREHAYSHDNPAAENIYNKIIFSPLFYDLSEQILQWETEELWKLYGEHANSREKIDRIWEYLYSPDNFMKLAQNVRCAFLGTLLEKTNWQERGNSLLENVCSGLLVRNVLESFNSENRVYILYDLFTYALEGDFFRNMYFDSLLDKNLVIHDEKDIAWYKDIYLSAAEYMNYVHDTDSNWHASIGKILRDRSDRELYFLMSVASYDSYNATFMLLYEEQIQRVRRADGLFPWLRKVDQNNRLVSMFFLSLSARNKLIAFVKSSAKSRNREQINHILRKTCDLIKKGTEAHSQSHDYEDMTYLAYISYAVEDLLNYNDPEINTYLTSIIAELTQGNFLSNVFARAVIKKYPGFFSAYDLGDSKVDTIIEDVLTYLDKPPYENFVKPGGKVFVLVDFSDSAEDFISGQKAVMGRNMLEPDDEQARQGIVAIYHRYMKNISIEYHVAKDIVGKAFRKMLGENKYSLIFTRHHSYENNRFIGQGSDTVIPQIWSNIDIGYGKINSRMTLILTEEIVRAYLAGEESWDKIIERVEPRIRKYSEEVNFLYPNDLPLIISYVSLLADKNYSFGQNKVILYDGGCAGSVRSLRNIEKYKNSMLTDDDIQAGEEK